MVESMAGFAKGKLDSGTISHSVTSYCLLSAFYTFPSKMKGNCNII